MVTINPIKLSGNWSQGYALDVHTTEGSSLGSGEYGHYVFAAKRSAIGELLYRLKHKSDKSALDEIIDTAADFLSKRWKIVTGIDAIIPVPPSKPRVFEPVLEIGKGLGSSLKIPFHDELIVQTKKTLQLKGIYEYEERLLLIKNAFAVKSNIMKGKSILLLDDLFRLRAMLNAICDILVEQGGVRNVYVLTLTKTRSKA